MISKDTIISNYLNDNTVFADAINFCLYSGKQVIDSDNLISLDKSDPCVFIPTSFLESIHSKTSQEHRDSVRTTVFKQYNGTIYAVLGTTNQDDILHYTNYSASHSYDSYLYNRQNYNYDIQHCAEDVQIIHRSDLQHFNAKSLPTIVILVMYFGANEVNVAKPMDKLLAINDFELHEHFTGLQINLLAPSNITSEELNLFNSSLREVLGYIKYSDDKDKLISFINSESKMIIDADAASVISVITKTYIEIPDYAKEIDMCIAILDLINDSRAEGMLEGMYKGRDEGIAEGMSRGRAEGRCEGRYEGILSTLIELVYDNVITIKDAARRIGMSEEAFTKML